MVHSPLEETPASVGVGIPEHPLAIAPAPVCPLRPTRLDIYNNRAGQYWGQPMFEALAKVIADNPDKALLCFFSTLSAVVGTTTGLLLGRWLQRAGMPTITLLVFDGEPIETGGANPQSSAGARYTFCLRIANPCDVPRSVSLEKVAFFASGPARWAIMKCLRKPLVSALDDTTHGLKVASGVDQWSRGQVEVGPHVFESVTVSGLAKERQETDMHEGARPWRWIMLEFAVSPDKRLRFWYQPTADEMAPGPDSGAYT